MSFAFESADYWHTRSPVFGTRGIVATSQPLASEAGMRILQQGGTAADAAVAAAAALNVTQPGSTGIGGDCFALYYNAATKKVEGINASGRSPKELSIEKLRSLGLKGDSLPNFHAHTVTVPGAASGWEATVKKWGKLSLAKVLAPAIELAENGFPVAPKSAYSWSRGIAQLRSSPNGDEMLLNGKPPKAGEIMKMPTLAATFRAIAEHGAKGFYEGPIAQAIVDVVRQHGGLLSLEDLKSHKCTEEAPIHVNYRGVDIYEIPPNGQGLTALMALNTLSAFDLKKHAPLSVENTHLMLEAIRIAFADTRQYIADPDHKKVPVEFMLSPEYSKSRGALISSDRANTSIKYGYPFSSSDTVYLSVVDQWGNACSFINSNYMGFGTGLIPKGCGFTLQNRGANFSLDPNHPNCLAPGKRPYHTIIPGMALKDGELFASFGNMGGFMQPQGHVQLMVNMIDYGMDPQAALDMPRFCIEDGMHNGEIVLEDGYKQETIAKLKEMGHNINETLQRGNDRFVFGNGQIIYRSPTSKVLVGGSDLRADGLAIAW